MAHYSTPTVHCSTATSVAAVEQAFPDYSAVEKKAKAEEFIQRQLGAHGLHISNDVLDPLIEEAVLALHLVIADDSKPMTGFTSSPSVVPQAATNKK